MKILLILILLFSVLCFSCLQASATNAVYGPYFNDIESYNAYFSKNKLQDWFITAQELEFMGEFVAFYATASHYRAYTYQLKDENGTVFSIDIAHGTDDDWDTIEALEKPDNMQDMRYLQQNSSSRVIEHNNVRYIYEETENVLRLSYITWRSEDTYLKQDTYFCIPCSMLPDSVGQKETFLKLLLSPSEEDLTTAMDRFEDGITISNDPYRIVKIFTITISILVLIGGAVAIIIVYRKRHLRKKYAYFGTDV